MIIPVIDVMGGQVVRAVRGERQYYLPMVSRLCPGSDPVELARALCTHCDARQLYLADLDALQGGTPQFAVIASILQALPRIELWLDAGFAAASDAQAMYAALGAGSQRVAPVFGSESLRSPQALALCFADARQGLLSLDRRDGQRLDAAGCWEQPALWPARVIVMTLERVGAGLGPDLDTLRAVQARSPATALIGAGGIRNLADLDRARESGAQAWLVASALHDGHLPPQRH